MKVWVTSLLAFGLVVLGVGFVFASAQMSVVVFGRSDVRPIAPLFGAVVLAFGVMNWMVRRSVIDGRDARAIVIANEVHFIVAAILLILHLAAVGGTGFFILLTLFYVVGALWYGYVLLSR
jgi:hypothetical protein